MRIIIITQDEPFYLSENLNLLLKMLPNEHQVVGCVVSIASPFGKQESFFKKVLHTFNVFGIKFFLYYSIKYIFSKLNSKKSLDYLLKEKKIEKILLNRSINHKSSIKKIQSFKPHKKGSKYS